MAAVQRRRRGAQTATEAVQAAQQSGREVPVTHDEAGNEFTQRPFSLADAAPAAPAPVISANDMVLVYHKRRTRMWLSGGLSIGPEEEKRIPRKDAEHPKVKPHIVRLAE